MHILRIDLLTLRVCLVVFETAQAFPACDTCDCEHPDNDRVPGSLTGYDYAIPHLLAICTLLLPRTWLLWTAFPESSCIDLFSSKLTLLWSVLEYGPGSNPPHTKGCVYTPVRTPCCLRLVRSSIAIEGFPFAAPSRA